MCIKEQAAHQSQHSQPSSPDSEAHDACLAATVRISTRGAQVPTYLSGCPQAEVGRMFTSSRDLQGQRCLASKDALWLSVAR